MLAELEKLILKPTIFVKGLIIRLLRHRKLKVIKDPNVLPLLNKKVFNK